MKRSRFLFLMCMALFFSFFPFASYGGSQEEKKEELKLYSQSAVLLDAVSGRVLYGKNEDVIRPMASTTKIMTCIVALENGNLDDVVVTSSLAASQPKVHLGASKGEEFYLKDLLYSLMLESHNDSAVMIAEHIGGSVEGFADMMNKKAKGLGLSNTYFITPNGLDASVTDENGVIKEHSTTAADLSKIMAYCVLRSPKKELFLEITQTQNHYFTNLSKKRSYSCVNHNALLQMMPGAISGKTGFTGGAGYSYVGALKDGDRVFTIALLGCGWPPHKTYKWSDARMLLGYGTDQYQYKDVFKKVEFKPIEVENGIPLSDQVDEKAVILPSLNLMPEEETFPVLLKEKEEVTIRYDLVTTLTAPVNKGEVIGTVSYSLNGQELKAYPIYATQSIEKKGIWWFLKKVMEHYFMGIAIRQQLL